MASVAAFLLLPLATVSPAWSEPARPAPTEGGVSPQAARQAAGVTTLCTGYNGCANAGMGHAGYKAANGSMYWQMYSGHNCTNYAAYRMVKNGMPNQRPWSGGGNATYWGSFMSDITDKVPTVGAVAWWKANTGPAGSAGHVAYVEKVVSADEIIVSQDSWGGDFSWARITKGSSWPSGFIHFNDLSLENTEQPAVTGVARVGEVLNASSGAWNPNNVTYSYEWRASGSVIANATNPTLKVRKAHEGTRIRVFVTASQAGYPPATAASPRTPLVEPGEITNTLLPVISGTPKVDQPLTTTAGSWNPAPSTISYQWLANGEPVEGATAATFVPGPSHVDQQLSVATTATKAGYDDVTATSISSEPVALGTFTVAQAARLRGVARLGETVTFDPGTWSPSEATMTVEWLRDGAVIADATDTTYDTTVADLGRRLAARMMLTRDGYTPLVVRTHAVGTIRTEPRLRVRAKRPGRGKVTFNISARARGVGEVPGTIQVLSRGTVLKEFRLRNGDRSVTLRRLPSGQQKFKVRLLRTDTVLKSVKKWTVRVK